MRTAKINRFPELDYACNEAMNTLCTNLSFSGTDIKKIMITSCQPKEGKSFTSINLMRTMARLGKRVVMVDADLRKSTMVTRYAIKVAGDYTGLSHYLAGLADADDVLYATNIPNAYMVLPGKDVANSLTLINSERFPQMLNMLADHFDVVIIDVPPIGLIIDAARIAQYCDGVLFVVSDNIVTRKELADAKMQIEKTGCPILGAVLNKVTFDTYSAKRYYHRGYYYSHYGYGNYGKDLTDAEPAPKKTAKNAKR